MKDMLTPEQLGDMLTAGEITKEEAIETMAQRTRQEALKSLYSPTVADTAAAEQSPAEQRPSAGAADSNAESGVRQEGQAAGGGLVWVWLLLAVAVVLGLIIRFCK